MSVSRRSLLCGLACAGVGVGVGAGLAAPAVAAGGERKVQSIGLQLFTVRELMAVDAAATLAQVAQLGYAEVETAGTGNLRRTEFAAALSANGLTAPSAHVPIELVRQQPGQLLEAAAIIGYRYLVVPWLPPPMRSEEGYGLLADSLNRFGEQCAAAGVQLAYHNHDFEFASLGDATAFDFLLRNTDPTLVKFELDLYWATHAGRDPALILSGDPSRFPLCHVKDRTVAGDMAPVGAGQIDFARLFAAGTGLQHFFVEHDHPADEMHSIGRSIAAMKGIRY